MYVVKIQGSKLTTNLENDAGQWFLRIKLGDVVEAEVAVTHMTKRALHANLGTLFERASIQIHDFQHNLIHKELTGQITHLLAKDGKEEKAEPSAPVKEEAPKDDPRIGILENKIAKLERTIGELTDRISRLESLTS